MGSVVQQLYEGPSMVRASTLLQYAMLGWDYRHWYEEAHTAIDSICQENGWDASKFADVMAITSPRVQVSRNVFATVYYMRHKALPRGTMRSTRKAMENWEHGKGIAGRKTGPFAAAIKGDGDALVLDVWMAAALGVDQRVVTRLDIQAQARRRMQSVADTLGCTMAQAQAAVWCGIILTKNKMPARFERANDGKWGLNTRASRLMFGGV